MLSAIETATSNQKAMLISPIISAPAADPWMIFHEGFYYFCESRDQTTLYIRKSKSIFDIGKDKGVKVWSPPKRDMNSKNVWAPELHFLNDKWYIYYAADDGLNENHRMWVLESETNDPFSKYHCRGMLDTGGWAIDGTLLAQDDGSLYMIWSGWPGKTDGQQNIYIAPMQNPYTICGERVLIAEPEHTWERVAMAICEGPQILKRDGKLFVVYSASASWTEDYCLGMLAHTGGSLLNAGSWKKISGPVFQKSETIWGVGHCSFVKSPCQTEDWILYHAKSERKQGWGDRHVHAQRFSWRDDGSPHFGTPLPHQKAVSLSA